MSTCLQAIPKSRSEAVPISDRMRPLTPADVEALGLTLGPLCEVQHRPKMKPHHHIGGPARGIERHRALHEVLARTPQPQDVEPQ